MVFRLGPVPATPLLSKDGTVYDISTAKKPELDHVVCCNPAKALCGAFVAGQDVKFGDPGKSKHPCNECFNRAADGEKCSDPFCPGAEK